MQVRVSLFVALAAVLLQASSAGTIDAPARAGNGETERIIGGKSATEGIYPWATVLFYKDRFICSSSIISSRTILTAAHCVVFNGVTEDAKDFHAMANLRKSADEVRIDFESITPHPNYTDSDGIQNDIAFLTTTEPIPFSDTVKPVCIAHRDTDMMAYENATAMGWGNMRRSRLFPKYPNEMQYVEQNIRNNSECERYYGALEDSKICAGYWDGICSGDSGGPLVHMSADQEPVEIGVASYINAFYGCGREAPGVWTRVSSYNEFLLEKAVDGSSMCVV